MAEVSLGIPVYNSASFLGELFDCLRQLDPPPAEIVFLDDASSDDSVARIERFLAEYDKPTSIRLLRNMRNAGIAGAYNRLAREMRGEFVQLLDADDLLTDRDFYARIQPALRDNVDVVVTGLRSNARLLDTCSRLLGWMVPRSPPPWWPLLGSFATRAGVLYRRLRLIEAPFPDPIWPGSDVIHLLRLRSSGTCLFMARPTVHYRVHDNARSSQQRDYTVYREALTQCTRSIRVIYGIDLWLRRIGQRWAR